MNLKEQIEKYVPYNEQEEKDKKQILEFMKQFDDVLTRNNLIGHFSSSAFVVNKDRTKMVVVYHKIYDGWIYPGGHTDGEEDTLAVAVREVEEEIGQKPRVVEDFFIAIQTVSVKGHKKHGEYVSPHIHFDVIYLMEADDTIPLIYKEDESKGAKWILLEEATNETICDFARPIHKKIIEKIKGIK